MTHTPEESNVAATSNNARRRSAKSIRNRLFLLLALGVVAFGMVKAFMSFRETIRMYGCLPALYYRWGPALGDYREADPERKYPPMSNRAGNLFMDVDFAKPHINSPRFFGKKDERGFWGHSDPAFLDLPLEEKFTSAPFVYFGYALANEDQVLAFLEQYPSFIEERANFNDDLPAPEGRGSFGGDTFLRLSEKLYEGYGIETHSIPVLIEIPRYTEDGIEFRHGIDGGHVRYFRSSSKLEELGERFPMTPAIIEKVGEIKAHYQK